VHSINYSKVKGLDIYILPLTGKSRPGVVYKFEVVYWPAIQAAQRN